MKIPFIEKIRDGLLAIKGVYWSRKDNAYLVFRHTTVKTKVEALLGISNVFPGNYCRSDKNERPNTGEMFVISHPTDRKVFILFTPPVAALAEQVKRWHGVRYSKTDHGYILPATPNMLGNLSVLAVQTGIRLINQLPAGYLREVYAPNLKKIKFANVLNNLQKQIPLQVQTYVNAMMDYLMAKN